MADALLQNTPAQFHGRPELARSLTEELQQALREVSGGGDAKGEMKGETVRARARVRQRSHDQGAVPASFRVVATNCSSFSCAAPDATAERARSMPSGIEPATFAA